MPAERQEERGVLCVPGRRAQKPAVVAPPTPARDLLSSRSAAQQPGPESEVNAGLGRGRLPANHYGTDLCFNRRKRESEDEKRREQSTQLAPKLSGDLGFLPELGYSRLAIIAGALDGVAPSPPFLSLEPCSGLQAELKPECIVEKMEMDGTDLTSSLPF